MREMLFRGKRTDNGEWVEGSLLYDREQNESYIAEHFEDKAAYIREVIPETVGQYAGLTDKNGTKIFEGDVVKWSYNPFVAKVVFHNGGFCMEVEMQNSPSFICLQKSDLWEHELLGNIYDNPELLKGGKNER